MRLSRNSACVALFYCLITLVCSAAEYHVSPEGRFSGNGTRTRPIDLATALSASTMIKPGDTIWLHAGTYRGGFVSTLRGTIAKPVTVRCMPGARVTIDLQPRDAKDDGMLMLRGADVIFRDFEVLCSDSRRVTKIAGPWPNDIKRGGVDMRGDRLKAISLVVHDLQGGFGMWSEGEGGEISGCIIYNNGWQGPDRDHGHGIYAQNVRGTKRLSNNIIFHQFGYGVHVHGSEKAELKGFEILANIAFENGCFRKDRDFTPGIFVGGGSPVERLLVNGNLIASGGMRFGYPWGSANQDVVCTNNYCDGGLVVRDFAKATVTNNIVAATSNVVTIEGSGKAMTAGHHWNNNEYYITDGKWGEFALLEADKGRGLTFEQWQTETKFDAESKFHKGMPNKARVIIQRNEHDPARANIAIINPAELPEVKVDLSTVLKPGQKYRIVSVKDFYGKPVLSGTFDHREINLPMQPIASPLPIGLSEANLPNCEPKFACFVLMWEK